MAYNFPPVSQRVMRIRERYRSTTPRFSSERVRIITDYYKSHEAQPGLLKRAGCMLDICSKMTVLVGDDDLIVGNLAPFFRGSTMNPEFGGVGWLVDELNSGKFYERESYEEYNEMSEEDADYIRSIESYWEDKCLAARCDSTIPEGFYPVESAKILPFNRTGTGGNPIGHFAANYRAVIARGFASIKEEADANAARLECDPAPGSAFKCLFYRSVSIYCDAVMTLARRYAAECERLSKETRFSDERRAELKEMAASLYHIVSYPARNFYEAVQAAYIYHLTLCFDGQLHGLTFGRFDQYTWPELENDLKEGRIIIDRAQEIVDCLFLKISESAVCKTTAAATNSGGYSTGQHISLGGVDKDGNDATNEVSYLMLNAVARLSLHEPPMSLRIHKGTPDKLWNAAIECTKRVGGIPTLQNDDIIIPTLLQRGFSIEDARDYCIIGCVEPAGGGNDFPCCGGLGRATYLNMGNLITMLFNNGINPMSGEDSGFGTGYLYDYKSFDEVMQAYTKHVEHYVSWHVAMSDLFWLEYRDMMPIVSLSATQKGCMESGMDVMYGGAQYNSNGASGVGCANVIDSLYAIKHLCFDKKICTTRELYDALMANWEGFEDLRQYVLNVMPRYGNDEPEVDELGREAMDIFARAFLNKTGIRGNTWQAGIYPVSTHVVNGQRTWATPDGRLAGEPLADGVSPKQGLDKNGPAAVLKSVAALDHAAFRNGTLLNMKFHPATVQGDDGVEKLKNLVRTFFDLGGMHIQYNVVGADQLRRAQEAPEEYKNLVIRIAGFSAYFVELAKSLQDDLITRTDQMV